MLAYFRWVTICLREIRPSETGCVVAEQDVGWREVSNQNGGGLSGNMKSREQNENPLPKESVIDFLARTAKSEEEIPHPLKCRVVFVCGEKHEEVALTKSEQNEIPYMIIQNRIDSNVKFTTRNVVIIHI